MQQDFLDDLAELALGSRLKRLSERMLADAAAVYKAYGVEAQPRWFTLLALIYRKGPTSVVDAANALGLSQPAISQFCRQLTAQGYIALTSCEQDSRRKVIGLTEEGLAQVEYMQPMWRDVDAAAKSLCTDLENNFYQALQTLEQAMQKQSLYQRVMERKDAN